MKDICFTYLEPGMKYSKYLISFFRMIGIYTYERILRDNEGNTLDYSGVDLSNLIPVFLVADNPEPFLEYREQGACYLVEEGVKWPDGENVLFYKNTESNREVLQHILDLLSKEQEQFAKEQEDLVFLADVFEECHITETLMGTRYYYAAPEKDLFALCQNYDKAVDQILDALHRESDSKNARHFLRFALIYLAYEYDYYCSGMNRGFLFDAKELLSLASDLTDTTGFWVGPYLLIAQIYGDLRKKPGTALEYYESLSNSRPYLAFAWYKRAKIIQEHYGAKKALELYQKAITVCPGYYRANDKVAECLLEAKKNPEAQLQYFQTCGLIGYRDLLSGLNPVDVRYLFFLYIEIAKIKARAVKDYDAALKYCIAAEDLYERLNQIAKSYSNFSGLNEEILKVLFRGSIDKSEVADLFDKIAALYDQVGEEEKAFAYKKKRVQLINS